MKLHCENIVTLDGKLKDGKLTKEDFLRVKQIPSGLIKVPGYETQPNAYLVIDELIESLGNGGLDIPTATLWFDSGTTETKDAGIKRLVTALAYALKEQDSNVRRSQEETRIIVGSYYFRNMKVAERIGHQLANEEQVDVEIFSDEKMQYFYLDNNNIIRSCRIFWIDSPNYQGHVQILQPRRKISSSIEYLDVRSP